MAGSRQRQRSTPGRTFTLGLVAVAVLVIGIVPGRSSSPAVADPPASDDAQASGPFALQPGFPLSIGVAVHGSPAIADLDGDGFQEIIVPDLNGSVHAIRHDGSFLPGWPTSPAGGAIFSAPAVGDIDGDGDLEVVVTVVSPPKIAAFHHTGLPVAGFPKNVAYLPGDEIRAPAVLANLDTDPALEILTATAQGLVLALDAPGGMFVPGWPQSLGGGVRAAPVVADLNRDGPPEVLVKQAQYVYVLDNEGNFVAGWPRSVQAGHGSPAVADLNGDGTAEVVVLEGTGIYLLAPSGAAINRRVIANFAHFSEGGMAIGNLTGGPDLEIVFPGEGGTLHLVDRFLNPLPGWPRQLGGEAGWAPILADVNGDGLQEILIGLDNGSVRVLTAEGDSLGPALPPLPSGVRGALAVGDLDGDLAVELVAADINGTIQVYDFSGPWDPYYAEWPTAQGSERRNGVHRSVADLPDADGDLDPDLFDCEPNDPAVHHGAAEVCNAIDDDCDGEVDDLDADADGFTACADDCDDASAAVYPGATQLCDGINNDCNDAAWPEPSPNEADTDFDGYRICAGDCDDTQAAIRPNGSHLCDGLNNDCLHPSWPALTGTNETDDDGDSVTECSGDCDDARPAIYPGAPQVCGDGLNNDCLAPGWPLDATDSDDDVDGLAECQGDCNDFDPDVRPGAPEICDGRDTDCDGSTPATEADADSDGYLICTGDCDDTRSTVSPGAAQVCGDGLNNDCVHPSWPQLTGTNELDDDGDTFTECAGDCDDTRATVRPEGEQICGDGVNNDCSDPSWPVDLSEADIDDDGFSACAGDCDDLSMTIYPGAPEICDRKDSNCDGVLPPEEADADVDGFAVCQGDCDDASGAIYPGALQTCGDGLNNNCLHPTWPALAGTNEVDDDGDGITECASPSDCDDAHATVYPGAPQICGDGLNNDCLAPGWPAVPDESDVDRDGFIACGPNRDCNDQSPYIYPGAPQICGDGYNNDCLDPGWPATPANELDQDGDTFTGCEGDCDDAHLTVYPGAPQICGDGLNNDCLSTFYPQLRGTVEWDDDGDGLTECAGDCDDVRSVVYPAAPQICDGLNNDCTDPLYPSIFGTNEADDDGDQWSLCEGDCHTLDPNVYPGAPQLCGDGLNNDCLHPEWPADTTETDDDGDGQSECSVASDCNDANAAIYAFAPQVCGDGLNNDCRHPSWPMLAGTNESDDDGDAVTECSIPPDCSDGNGSAWATPAEVETLMSVQPTPSPYATTILSWTASPDYGATGVVYDLLRSGAPWDFTSAEAVCLVTGTTSLTAGDPIVIIPPPAVYFYLVRPRNGCPGASGVGVAGRDSTGAAIPTRACP